MQVQNNNTNQNPSFGIIAKRSRIGIYTAKQFINEGAYEIYDKFDANKDFRISFKKKGYSYVKKGYSCDDRTCYDFGYVFKFKAISDISKRFFKNNNMRISTVMSSDDAKQAFSSANDHLDRMQSDLTKIRNEISEREERLKKFDAEKPARLKKLKELDIEIKEINLKELFKKLKRKEISEEQYQEAYNKRLTLIKEYNETAFPEDLRT